MSQRTWMPAGYGFQEVTGMAHRDTDDGAEGAEDDDECQLT